MFPKRSTLRDFWSKDGDSPSQRAEKIPKKGQRVIWKEEGFLSVESFKKRYVPTVIQSEQVMEKEEERKLTRILEDDFLPGTRGLW
jgi:hypothetical protein